MVMPLGPRKFSCQRCGWSRVINQHSDVIHGPRHCPHCNGDVVMTPASLLDRLLSLEGLFPRNPR